MSGHSVRRGLIYVAALAALSFLERPEQHSANLDASKNEHGYSDRNQENLHSNDRPDGEKEAHEHTHRVHEKLFWIVSIALTVTTIIVAGYAARFAYGALTDGHEALISVQRAFIYASPDPLDLRAMNDPKGAFTWGFIPVWENSGNTPAKSLTVETDCMRAPMSDHPETGITTHNTPLKRVIGPHQKITGQTCGLYMKDIQSIMDGTATFAVIYRARYTDIFDMLHQTEGCWFTKVVTGDLSRTQPLYIAVQMCDTHNCADDQCHDK